MKKELKKIHEHYRNNYYDEEIANRIKDNVHQNIRNSDMLEPKKKQQWSFMKKISYATAACVMLFGLFVGSAFVSPAMAEVASKIPFLSKIFEQEPIFDVLTKELKDKGYDIDGTGYTVQGKTYHITVAGSEEYYNQVKDDIKVLAEDVISSRGYDSFKVEVNKVRAIEPDADLENNPKYQNSQQVSDVLREVVSNLQQQGYKIDTYGISFPSPDTEEIRLNLDIEDTEKRTDDIEIAIVEGIEKEGLAIDYTIEFHPFNVPGREIENTWTTDILPVIWEGILSIKEYKTEGVGYSYKNGTMNIFFETSIDKSDNDAPELANKIETAIHEFLQSDDLKDIVGDTPYKVVVRDKDSNEIN
ncbi:DUF4179 domain-containing protein [Paucisalibacillus sp. EB02]|uniref:DUF4179 domain-containing protein n=1 Tax=Paucisalibacillus sp. EB02 TaxID=1347087 RepID=UPI0004B5776B|nr:DUF4179 domain-containing protein [Paucisalibacillus sp. EB02]